MFTGTVENGVGHSAFVQYKELFVGHFLNFGLCACPPPPPRKKSWSITYLIERSQLLQSLNFISTFGIHFEKAPSNLSEHDSFQKQKKQKKPAFLGKWIKIEYACAYEGKKGEVESSIKLTKKTNWRMPGRLNSFYSSYTNWLKIDFHFLL